MPAETHSRREPVDVGTVLDVIASVIGIDPDAAADRRLTELELDDELAMFHLWDAVVEELGERAVGELEPLGAARPVTPGELAEVFHAALSRGRG